MKIYTLKEIAKLLRCSERQIFRYIEADKLKGSNHGRWRFTDENVRDFLKSGKNKPSRRK